MKLVVAGVASVAIALSLVACAGGSNKSSSNSTTPSPTASHEPVATATFVPTSITSAPTSLAPGAPAQVSVQTHAGARCAIAISYSSGPKDPDAIPGQRADKDGHVTWSWNVTQQAPPGKATLIINCDTDVVESQFIVT